MSLIDQAAADIAALFPEISGRYEVTLYGVPVFTLAGRYDRGGRLQAINEAEVVITKPSFVVASLDAPRLSKDHAIATPDGSFKIFGGGVQNGLGLTSFDLIKS